TVLLLFVLCQTFAVGAQGMVLRHAETEENQHALLHWEGVAHHHSENGMTYQDNSDECAQHMLTDMVMGAGAGLLPAALATFLPERSPPPRAASESSGPLTYPDGPRRPPRLIA
ncbi:MAG: hypothetical protein Q8S56_06660, partial [Polaromonas sp.]|nr:hypothetical protein [Polaromonas sp.]